MTLYSGRLFAEVPKSARGFRVDTPYNSVVDLGTQIGVRVEPGHASDLHLFKGEASLIPGREVWTGKGQTLKQGQARRVDTAGYVQDIQIETTAFVRRFFSESGLAWRGQAVDLGDVVGGGNGFGTGQLNRWLAISTGKDGTTLFVNGKPIAGYQTTDNQYHPVSHLPCVDGVFSPDGGMGKVQVTSKGHMWEDCPQTCGRYFEDIFNGPCIAVGEHSHRLVLGGQAYGTKEHPAIALHSNAGITFDLDAVRGELPRLDLGRFRATCGISEQAGAYTGEVSGIRADFWVLIDGKRRFTAIGMGVDSKPQEISVTLERQDRFVTLVSTDGDGQANYDWCFFAEPRLEVNVAE